MIVDFHLLYHLALSLAIIVLDGSELYDINYIQVNLLLTKYLQKIQIHRKSSIHRQ
jgi:hypothetical protein